MTNYYVRTDGSNANAGTSSGTGGAWQTIAKALGASGISSGDTVYIAPGVYRETVTCSLTNPTVETSVIGDVDASEFSDLQGGDVIWTAYTTNDKTNPSSTSVLNLSDRDFMTFVDLHIVGGDSGATEMFTATTASTSITFRRCLITSSGSMAVWAPTCVVDVAANFTFDSCIFRAHGAFSAFTFTLPTSTSADYDAEIIFKNCLFHCLGNIAVSVGASGANAFKGGGVKIYDCTILAGGSTGLRTTSANVATSAGNKCEVYNCLVYGTLNANTSGQIVEDYNYIIAATPRTNVTAGANSKTSATVNADQLLPQAMLVHMGQEKLWGQYQRPFFSPILRSPLLGFGNDGSVGVQTVDFFGDPRPCGPARTWANASKAIGYSERPNTAAREATTVRTGTYAIKLLGPSVQDVEIPVSAASTTVTVYGRYDSAYGGGTLPRMRVMANGEIGVTEATDTMVSAADTWEQLSLNFTPTAAGIVTVRMMSDGDGDGSAFFDDFAVA